MATSPALAMTFEESVGWLGARGRFGIKLGLERMRTILESLGHPEASLTGALIAGTNGKGSTAAMLAAILMQAGHRVGLMPSPHLSSYRERVQVDLRPISALEFANTATVLREKLSSILESEPGGPTEFELLTAVALLYLGNRVDRFVCEVGMGGRLDATNVLDLGVAIVTNVSLDHQQHLGKTVPTIAREKAGIVKPGNLVVTGCRPPALEEVEASAAGADDVTIWRLGQEIRLRSQWLSWDGSSIDVSGPGFEHRGLHVPLVGAFQAENAALAVAAAEAMGTPSAAVARGLPNSRWAGRLERIGVDPVIVLDGAHNIAGMASLVRDLRRLLQGRRIVIVFGAMRDHQPRNLLGHLRRLRPAAVVCTAVEYERAAPAADLVQAWGPGAEAITPSTHAVEVALDRAGPGGAVVVCGSLYLVGEVRAALVGPEGGDVG